MATRGKATKATPKARAGGRPKRTDWQARFLAILSESANVTHAAGACRIGRKAVYKHRGADPAFASAWDNAMEQATDTLEAEARRRAFDGVEEPVWHQGMQCGTVRKYSDTLIIFLLKGHRPERFRERYEHKHSGSVEHRHRHDLDRDELQTIAQGDK